MADAAGRLGISADAGSTWLRKGQTPGRLATSRRWCIPWEAEAVYRAKVAASVRLKPRPQGVRLPDRLTGPMSLGDRRQLPLAQGTVRGVACRIWRGLA